MKSAAVQKGSEVRSVRARVRVRVRVREQVSVPRPPQASMATCTGWDSASVQVQVVERRRALGWARRFESTVERLERLRMSSVSIDLMTIVVRV